MIVIDRYRYIIYDINIIWMQYMMISYNNYIEIWCWNLYIFHPMQFLYLS